MADLKHLKTFESFSEDFDNQEVELIDEGLSDWLNKIADKVGVAAEDILTQWKKPEVIAWAKKMAPSYLQNGSLNQDAYDQAATVNFDPSNNASRDFFVQMAKIKGAKLSAPMSANTRLIGNS